VGIFNTFTYSDGTLYGNLSKLEFSVEPFTCKAISNDMFGDVLRPRVDLSWANPSGDVFGFRIVRNQNGYSETEEDGHIIFETIEPPLPSERTFTDQLYEIPLLAGKYVYYTIWVLLANNSWYPSGGVYTLIPRAHSVVSPEGVELKSSEYKFVDLLPRTFTSAQKSAIDEIDQTSDLFTFLSGFSYTLDEILTFADLLAPSLKGKNNNPNFVGIFSEQLGLPVLPNVSLKTQKRLIREAIYLNQYRGTASGIGRFVEALTSFAPTISTSPNLLLNPQESTFYKGVGRWKNVSTNLTLTATTEAGSPSGELYAVDNSWSGKYATISTSSTSWLLGQSKPLTEGIPVKEDTEYTFSFYAKGTGTGTTGLRVFFFDINGEQLTNYEPTYEAINSTWTKYTYDYTTPAGTMYLGLQLGLLSPQTAKNYYWDMIQVAETSDVRSADFHEARAVEIYLAPNKVNLIENPSFVETVADEDTDWVFTDADTITYITPTTVPGVEDGSHMVSVETVDTNELVISTQTSTVTSGVYYTFSIYAKTDADTEPLSFTLSAYDDTDTLLEFNGEDVSATFTPVGGVTDTWARYSVTLFVPLTDSIVYLLAEISGTTTGNTVFLDASQVEQGYRATDYFDGNYFTRGAYWVGDVDDSKSIFYSGKVSKLGNLTNQLPEFLPMNTAYVVTTGFDSLTTLEIKGFSS
jgi:hypothetical protein